MTTAADVAGAYKWTRDWMKEPLLPLPEIHNPAQGAIDRGLDDTVRWALEKSGLMGWLEQVTGDADALTAAARTWQDQARATREIAEELRRGGEALSADWHGQASAAFGLHMGQVVEAIDATAEDMAQTAQILSQAAAECRLAEDLVVEIIREAIEWLAVTLAAGLVADILTLGLATVVDALVVEAEMLVFIARVEKVSVSLARKLRTLRRLIKEMREAEKAGAAIKRANSARKMVGRMRKGGKSAFNPGSWANPYKSPERFLTSTALKGFQGAVAEPLLEGATGLTGSPTAPIGDAFNSDTNIDAIARDVDGRPAAPAYRVPKSRIEEAFG
ncbi:type VII secretion system (Wss) protein ESAT-6 [Streptomyces sp. TLI_235]|nr:WXG100 family type VII secretion target [Streptomyces sp. TLI_235]PBC70908.1 type VII secretion system (Wss) protein ESAT-6 [Streptomyces sp. TLI_235]